MTTELNNYMYTYLSRHKVWKRIGLACCSSCTMQHFAKQPSCCAEISQHVLVSKGDQCKMCVHCMLKESLSLSLSLSIELLEVCEMCMVCISFFWYQIVSLHGWWVLSQTNTGHPLSYSVLHVCWKLNICQSLSSICKTINGTRCTQFLMLGVHAHEGYSTYFVCLCVCLFQVCCLWMELIRQSGLTSVIFASF